MNCRTVQYACFCALVNLLLVPFSWASGEDGDPYYVCHHCSSVTIECRPYPFAGGSFYAMSCTLVLQQAACSNMNWATGTVITDDQFAGLASSTNVDDVNACVISHEFTHLVDWECGNACEGGTTSSEECDVPSRSCGEENGYQASFECYENYWNAHCIGTPAEEEYCPSICEVMISKKASELAMQCMCDYDDNCSYCLNQCGDMVISGVPAGCVDSIPAEQLAAFIHNVCGAVTEHYCPPPTPTPTPSVIVTPTATPTPSRPPSASPTLVWTITPILTAAPTTAGKSPAVTPVKTILWGR